MDAGRRRCIYAHVSMHLAARGGALVSHLDGQMVVGIRLSCSNKRAVWSGRSCRVRTHSGRQPAACLAWAGSRRQPGTRLERLWALDWSEGKMTTGITSCRIELQTLITSEIVHGKASQTHQKESPTRNPGTPPGYAKVVACLTCMCYAAGNGETAASKGICSQRTCCLPSPGEMESHRAALVMQIGIAGMTGHLGGHWWSGGVGMDSQSASKIRAMHKWADMTSHYL